MVRDHFAILKVGPALTFAYREAVFALTMIEDEIIPAGQRSHLQATLEAAMLRNPKHWETHYPGTDAEQACQRKYSLSDRIRYYWTEPTVVDAVARLWRNFEGKELPSELLNDILPVGFGMDRKANAETLVQKKILAVLEGYYSACGLN